MKTVITGTICTFVALVNLAAAQEVEYSCDPGTLFQWSYGTSFSGGPDLDEPLVTDRPDFTEASSTVGRGVTQLEMGYVYVNDRSPNGSFDGHSYPDLLVRQGILAEWLELRVVWSYLNERQTMGNVTANTNGSSDIQLGAKIGLTPQENVLPEMALIPQMSVPVGGGEVLPGVNWIYAWDLTERISMAGSSQINRSLDDQTGDPFGLFAQSWVFGYSITDCLGAYTEWFALIPDGAESHQTQHFVNGGLTYLVNNDVQLDLRAGVALSDGADDFFVGTGVSIRFP